MSTQAPSENGVTIAPEEPAALEGAAPPVERPPLPPAVMISLWSIVALATVLLFILTYALGFSALQEQRSQHQLYASFRGLLDPASQNPLPIGGVIEPGTPVALINAPAAGLHSVMVVEGTSSGDLLKGPGHLRDSPLPGQPGQSVIIAKSLTAGGPFRHITRLRVGDIITVTTGQSVFHFKVIDTRVGGDPLPALASGAGLLTLATSAGSSFLGALAPTHVVYVDAALQGSAASPPDGDRRPVAVPAAELPGRGDPGAWLFLVLWLQALLVSVGVSVWAWVKWGKWQTWLVGVPIIVAVLWGISYEVMRLLPNVL